MKYAVGNHVKFVKTASNLDGKTGEVIGYHSRFPEVCFCIVLLHESLLDRADRAVVMIDSCLTAASPEAIKHIQQNEVWNAAFITGLQKRIDQLEAENKRLRSRV